MKIVHLLTTSHFSGAENVVSQIIGLFADSDCEMIYCSPDGQINEALRERNISFYPISDFTSEAVSKAFEKIKPDIIHAHDMRASYMAAKVCGRIPVISHIHNNGFDARKLSKKTLGFLWASRKINHIFWVSKSAASDFFFNKFVSAKSSVLPNIIDLVKLRSRAAEAKESDTYDVVFLGRMQYPKNPMRFVDIINILKSKYPSVKAAIIGQGDQRELTEQKIKDYKLEDNVHLLGFLSNPMEILRKAKALVMTSFWEGTPMCSLEALGLGTPVVSTPVDGLKDIIVNEDNGYLSDSDEELANQLYKILTNKDYYSKLSDAAIKTAERINDKSHYREAIIKEYNNALKK